MPLCSSNISKACFADHLIFVQLCAHHVLRITIVYNINDRAFTTPWERSFCSLMYVTVRWFLLIFLQWFLALEDFEDREQETYCIG